MASLLRTDTHPETQLKTSLYAYTHGHEDIYMLVHTNIWSGIFVGCACVRAYARVHERYMPVHTDLSSRKSRGVPYALVPWQRDDHRADTGQCALGPVPELGLDLGLGIQDRHAHTVSELGQQVSVWAREYRS